jgi:hypothetical protein
MGKKCLPFSSTHQICLINVLLLQSPFKAINYHHITKIFVSFSSTKAHLRPSTIIISQISLCLFHLSSLVNKSKDLTWHMYSQWITWNKNNSLLNIVSKKGLKSMEPFHTKLSKWQFVNFSKLFVQCLSR